MTIVLGIHEGHDSGAALVVDGKLIAAASEERFKRIKHCSDFPEESTNFVLREAALRPKDVEYVALTDQTPLLELLIKQIKPYGFSWFTRKVAKLVYNKAKKETKAVFNRQNRCLPKNDGIDFLDKMGIKAKRIAVDHHHAHASSAYRLSGMNKAAVVTLDGAGESIAGTVYVGNEGEMEKISESFEHGGSVGLFYAAVTFGLGFKINDGEGKTMGLAAYGDPDPAYNELLKYTPSLNGLQSKDGFIWSLNIEYQKNKHVVTPVEPWHMKAIIDKYGRENTAAAAQRILEQNIQELTQNIYDQTGISKIAAGGGVFLNVKANKLIIENDNISELFVHPHAGDGGLAVGAALEAYYQVTGHYVKNKLENAYLGSHYSTEEILDELKTTEGIQYEKVSDVPGTAADLLLDEQVIGWFQGKMEWGPRALGHRSVLADPRDADAKERLNNILKRREWFMPFAPSAMDDQCGRYFQNYVSSPFMLLAFDVEKELSGDIPGVIHVDNTVRPQGVTRENEPLYYELINNFYKETGVPMVLNTSFNKHGLPIVESPKDAIDHLKWNCVDVLVIGDYLVTRNGKNI